MNINRMTYYKWSCFIVLYRAIGIYVLKLDIVPDIINEMNINKMTYKWSRFIVLYRAIRIIRT